MTFFERLFGRKKAYTAAPAIANDDIALDIPPASLFTETESPAEIPAPPVAEKTRFRYRPSFINDFLSQDFRGQGLAQALQFPAADRRESALKLLRANFRQSLDKAAQSISADLESHEQEMLRIQGISEIVDHQMKRRKTEMEGLLQRISHQLELSIDDEGWLAPAVAAYMDGFTEGTMQYMQQNELLVGFSTLR